MLRIEVNLHGGLGNQLFQLAYALIVQEALSEESRSVLNTRYLLSYGVTRAFGLEPFVNKNFNIYYGVLESGCLSSHLRQDLVRYISTRY